LPLRRHEIAVWCLRVLRSIQGIAVLCAIAGSAVAGDSNGTGPLQYRPNSEPRAVEARERFRAKCLSSIPRLVWPEGRRVKMKSVNGRPCHGDVIEVASDGRVTSPADGYVRVVVNDAVTTIGIRHDSKSDIEVSGSFEHGAEEGDFVLALEPIARFGGGERYICLEVRDCEGKPMETGIFIWEEW